MLGQQVVEGQFSDTANKDAAGEEAAFADPAPSDAFSGREQVMEESFEQPDQDADTSGDVKVDADRHLGIRIPDLRKSNCWRTRRGRRRG